ncbi:MAG: hypothetical protein ACOYLV_09490 [Rubrivivax sp.]
MPLPPVGSTPSYSVTSGPLTPYDGTQVESFDAGDTLDLNRVGGVLYGTSVPQAMQPTGSTGNFLWAGANNPVTLQFAQAVNYYGFLWGSPDTSWGPDASQGVRLYSGSTLVGTYTVDSLGLNGTTRFVNFFAAQGQEFTRAELFSHTNFETDHHTVSTGQPVAPTYGTDLITNGSFEADDIPSGFQVRAVTGWTGITASTAELQDGIVTPNPGTGSQNIELMNGGVRQSVTTTAGKSYQLNFAYRYGNDGTAASNAFEVWFNNQKVADVNPVQGQPWQGASFTLSGTGSAANLEFRMKAGQENGEGAALDAVQLREVLGTTSASSPQTVIDFEEFTTGDQNSSILTSKGYTFKNRLANFDDTMLVVAAGYPSKVLHANNWSDNTTLTRSDGSTFDLVSFDYGPDQYSYQGDNTLSDAVVTGTFANGTTLTTTFSDSLAQTGPTGQKTMATLSLNWTNLTAVKIDWAPGTSPAYGTLDNFRLGSAAQPPTLSAPSAFTVVEDMASPLVFTGTPFSDSDSATLTVTLAVADGSIFGQAATGIAIGGTGTARTFTGSVADLNAYFTTAGRINYTTAPNNTVARTLTTRVTDGVSTTTATSTLQITPVNDAPTVRAPTSFSVLGNTPSPLFYSGTPFGDIDSGILTVTLSVADGTISGAAASGITVGGTATARTFTGSIANLNAYFTTSGRITYTTAQDNTASRTLTTRVSDGFLSDSATSTILITPWQPDDRRTAPAPITASGAPRAKPAGLMTFDRSIGPLSVDGSRPTETFEPTDARILATRGGIPVGPTSGTFPGTYASLDAAQHVMVVAASAFRPQAREMTVDLTGRPTTSFGFQWNTAQADNTVEMYAGTKLLGRYTPAEVFADAPAGSTPSAYVTFRTVDGTLISHAVFSSASPFEVDNLSTDGDLGRTFLPKPGSRAARSVYTRFDTTALGPPPAASATAPAIYRPTLMLADHRARPVPDPATTSTLGSDIVVTEPEIQTRARLAGSYAALAGGLASSQELSQLLGMRL